VITSAFPWDRPSADPDRALVDRMAGGDPDALRSLCEIHGPHVLAFLVGQLGDRSLAEDVAQEVMLAAWRGAARFRGESRVRTWLLGIAHHLAANTRRRNGHMTVSVDDGVIDRHCNRDDLGATSDAGIDARIDLRAALHCLPPHQRAALGLVFFHGMSVDETARILGVAPGTVKSRLHRARAALRAQLGATYEHDL
jgi:RNA polymerase sigma-70 factor, ECF subfamily